MNKFWKGVEKVLNVWEEVIVWRLVMVASLFGFLLEEGIGYYDVIFWVSMAVLSIRHTLSKVTLVRVVEDE